jgi:hypothetical protein
MQHWWNVKWQGKTEAFGETPAYSDNFVHQKSHMELNEGLHGEKHANNHLSYDTVCKYTDYNIGQYMYMK